MNPSSDPTVLQRLAATRDNLPAAIRRAVADARKRGETWPSIAAQLGTSTRAAQKWLEGDHADH